MVTVQSQGPRNNHREVTYLQLGSPAVCVGLCIYICRQAAYLFLVLFVLRFYRHIQFIGSELLFMLM